MSLSSFIDQRVESLGLGLGLELNSGPTYKNPSLPKWMLCEWDVPKITLVRVGQAYD